MLQYYCKENWFYTQRIKSFLVALIALITADTLAQGRLVLNRDVVVNFHGGKASNTAFVEVDKANSNAVSSRGSGRIHSQGELNILRWNGSNGTGTYNVPFGDSDSDRLPLMVDITRTGSTSPEQLYVQFTHQSAEFIQVEIRNPFGALIRTQNFSLSEGLNLLNLNIENLESGQYYVTVVYKSAKTDIIKFVKMD